MSFIIGFHPREEKSKTKRQQQSEKPNSVAKKSLVNVRFSGVNKAYTYYNDLFDLKVGDIVFVDGCFEGKRGTVTEVSYSFKIKLSDYKKVVAVADTTINGEMMFAPEHFISFDKDVIPFSKIATWFVPPLKENEEIVESEDENTFLLDDPQGFKADSLVVERGKEYYIDNKVVYLELDGSVGRAIVEGQKGYIVEFCYNNGEISKLRCDCYCVGACKHEIAVLLQLRDLLRILEQNFSDEYQRSKYFSAIYKPTLFMYSVFQKDKGKIKL